MKIIKTQFILCCILLVACTETIVEQLQPLRSPTELKVFQLDEIVKLIWVDNDSQESGFIIERRLGNDLYGVIGETLTNETTYFDSTAIVGNTYYYRVKSFNNSTESDYTDGIGINLLEPFLIAPTELNSIQEGENLRLNWIDNDSLEFGFIIERKLEGSSFEIIAETLSDEQSYLDSTISTGIVYYYRVKSFNDKTKSVYSNETENFASFLAPSNITINSVSSIQLSLSWSDNGSFEKGFIIERSTNNNDFTEVAQVDMNTTSFTDLDLDSTISYQYRLKAITQRNSSDYSSNISVSYNLGEYSLKRTFSGHTGAAWAVHFSPDGQLLATGGGSDDGTVKVWNVSNGTIVKTLTGFSDVRSVRFSPDGTALAASGDAKIKLWNVSDWSEIRTLNGASCCTITVIRFSPDGAILASGSAEKTVRLWNVNDGTLIQTLSGHTGTVWSLAFRPDGMNLASGGGGQATGSDDSFIRIWDTKSGALINTYNANTILVWSLEYDNSGNRLGCGTFESNTYSWDISTGEIHNELDGKRMTFNFDGSIIASSSGSQLYIWDAETLQQLLQFSSQSDAVYGMDFSPINNNLVTTSYDKSVKLWSFSNRWQISQ
jgi:WD40 repeat protein